MPRPDGRAPDALRPVRFTPAFQKNADGSCLVECGKTRVICSVSLQDGVPPWLAGRGEGWVTAEYAMLPASTGRRKERDGRRGKTDGRSVEIQRLIGRVLRGAIDRKKLGERTLMVDCDVLDADGGTRTAAINGAMVAIRHALTRKLNGKLLGALAAPVGAISVGILKGEVLLDLAYAEDAVADADMNVVMTAEGQFIEVQASSEAAPFDEAGLVRALAYAKKGIQEILALAPTKFEEA